MKALSRADSRPRRVAAVALLLCLATAVFAASGDRPVTVSPGKVGDDDGRAPSAVATACPTFSWGRLAGAAGYELEVWAVGDDGERRLALRQGFAGAVQTWTPPLERCLDRGTDYAWAVRALTVDGPSEWSEASRFAVVAETPDGEIARILSAFDGRPGAGVAAAESAPVRTVLAGAQAATEPGNARGAALLMPSAGDDALMVDGSPAVTVDTLRGALCATTEVRFLDQGDGTVLDCTTGNVWLKDASCLGIGTFSISYPPAPGSVQEAVDHLNLGVDFGCDGYTPGAYSNWRLSHVRDFCGFWMEVCQGPGCCYAPAGLLDDGFANPALANANVDGQWADRDPFVGVSTATGVPYWANGYYDVQNNLALVADISNGVVYLASAGDNYFVWPVRTPQ